MRRALLLMFALAARSASAFAGRRVLARASPRLLATAAAAPQVPVGEILLSEPGVVVVRDTAGVGGAEVEPGTRLALANGREGTVVLTRSPLCVVCLDRPRTFMSRACKHLALCEACIPDGASPCPVCRVATSQWDRVYA